MRKMKDSGVPWIGEIPLPWKCCHIKYFGDITGGTGFPVEYQGKTEEIYPFYKVSDLASSPDGKFMTTPNNSISVETARIIHAKIIRKNSIVYAKIGAALLLNRRRIILQDSIIDNNMSAFTPKNDINLDWCFYLFTALDFSIFIYPGTVPSFSEGNQADIKVPLPPKDLQAKIADYLDAKCAEIDRSMGLVRQSIDKLKEYKKSVITEAVTKGVDPDVPMKDSGVPWIGEIPEEWETQKLKFFLLSNDGGIWGDEPTGQDDTIVLRSTEQTIDGEWIIESPAFRHIPSDNLETFLLKEGDLVITKSSGSQLHIGKTSIVTKEIEDALCTFSNFMQRIRVKQTSLPRLIWYWLNSDIVRGQFTYASNTTSGLNNINSKNINELLVALPPLLEQQRIAAYLDTKCAQIDTLIAQKQTLLDKLAEYKKSLIFECVTGKREVAA